MKKQLLITAIAATFLAITGAKAQTLYVPSGTAGIGSGTSGNVTVGTTTTPANFNVTGTSTLTGATTIGASSSTANNLTVNGTSTFNNTLLLGNNNFNAGNPILSVTGTGIAGRGGLNSLLAQYQLYDNGGTGAYSTLYINNFHENLNNKMYVLLAQRYDGTTTTYPFSVDYFGNGAFLGSITAGPSGSTANNLTVNGGATVTGAVTVATSTMPSVPSSGGNVNSLQFAVAGSANISNALIVGSTSAFTASTPFPTGYSIYAQNGILTEKAKVAVKTTSNWSDFVFDKNYKLRPLSELESFINKNHHLPEIPSAEEVVKEGLDVAQMDAKLLQKIEELTLYMIEMKKEIEKQNVKIEALEKENTSLKKSLKK